MTALSQTLVERFGAGPRVESYYLPIAEWCLARLAEHRSPAASQDRRSATLFIGIHGPQGSGKSTLAEALVQALASTGVRALALSIDDFYWSHPEQVAVAEAFPGNRLLEHRGYPGTHDIDLGVAVLEALCRGEPVELPAYDKSAFGGRGDRVPRERWRRCEQPFDVVLFEGWLLGFAPIPQTDLFGQPALTAPNTLLARYALWHRYLDAMVVIHTRRLQDVVTWRVDAERTRRSLGQGALSETAARDYIKRFLPAYRSWVPGLLAKPPGRSALRIELGPDRLPVRAVVAVDLNAVQRRVAGLADLPMLLSLVERTLRRSIEKSLGPWNEALTRSAIESSLQEGHWQVLSVGGQPLGALALGGDATEVRLSELFLQPDQQGRGWGTALVAEVLADAHRRGLPVRLRVLRSNPAQRLYARLGFAVEKASRERLWMVARPPPPAPPSDPGQQ